MELCYCRFRVNIMYFLASVIITSYLTQHLRFFVSYATLQLETHCDLEELEFCEYFEVRLYSVFIFVIICTRIFKNEIRL